MRGDMQKIEHITCEVCLASIWECEPSAAGEESQKDCIWKLFLQHQLRCLTTVHLSIPEDLRVSCTQLTVSRSSATLEKLRRFASRREFTLDFEYLHDLCRRVLAEFCGACKDVLGDRNRTDLFDRELFLC